MAGPDPAIHVSGAADAHPCGTEAAPCPQSSLALPGSLNP
jgi:hypothetical protein